MKTLKNFVQLALVGLAIVSGRAQEAVGPVAPVAANPLPPAAMPSNLSSNAAEVVRLAEADVSNDVLMAFVQNAQSPYDLSAEDVLYLKDLGISSEVITAMLNHDNALRSQSPPAPAPAPAPVPAPQPVAPQPVAAPAPVYVSSPPPEVTYFYNDLSPYGTWVELEGIGWCWQPRVVVINRGWWPYCDGGHWVFSDCGWYWLSDYSWGWAAFHYGRWHWHDRCGWVWWPDRVWGPAWVSWRAAGDHCGWAPLPPHAEFDLHLGFRFNGVHVASNFDFGLRPDHFTFIAVKDFQERDLGHRRLATTEVHNIYNRTTIINNYVVNNNRVVNQGIPVERVAAATRTEIRKASIRELPASSGKVVRTQTSDKGQMVIYRPQLKAPEKTPTMVAQKVDAQHPVVRHSTIVPVRAAPTETTRSLSAPNTSRQIERSKVPERQNQERPATNPQNPPTRKTERSESLNPASPQSPRGLERAQEPARSQVNAASQPQPPVRGTRAAPAPGQSRSLSGDVPGQNPHVYYPKTYHQEFDGRSVPPAREREVPSNPRDAKQNERGRSKPL